MVWMPLRPQIRSNSTSTRPRPVNWLPLSVKTCSGQPNSRRTHERDTHRSAGTPGHHGGVHAVPGDQPGAVGANPTISLAGGGRRGERGLGDQVQAGRRRCPALPVVVEPRGERPPQAGGPARSTTCYPGNPGCVAPRRRQSAGTEVPDRGFTTGRTAQWQRMIGGIGSISYTGGQARVVPDEIPAPTACRPGDGSTT